MIVVCTIMSAVVVYAGFTADVPMDARILLVAPGFVMGPLTLILGAWF